MFQSYDDLASPQNAYKRLKKLRQRMEEEQIDAFLVPHSDEYQGEYIADGSKRLEWLTGFTGSAGFAIILRQEAILFVDGRYSLQARQQTDPNLFTYQDLIASPPTKWLHEYVAKHGSINSEKKIMIGFDPWLLSMREVKALRNNLEENAQLKAIAPNPIDIIWTDRPLPPTGKVFLHPQEYAGKSAQEKLFDIRNQTRKHNAQACLITDTAGIAWAFNIRGKDVEHNPVAHAYALVPTKEDEANKAIIFIDKNKCHADILKALEPVAHIKPMQAIGESLSLYHTIMVDPSTAAEAFNLIMHNNNNKVMIAENPTALPRAIKNNTELSGARKAHLHDGVAMVRFLAWIDFQCDTYGAESLDEIKAAQKLEECRQIAAKEAGTKLEDISFDTISGSGSNGAIIHYRVTNKTNKTFKLGELYLVDSGGQYRHGTTDITRTVAIGKAGQEEKRCFTIVLKAMIALTTARFPVGSRGRTLDSLAREPLWQNGLDFAHGTGHGVGSFLNVHEGPQNISRNGVQELKSGMIISNEPGYYREGAFGIRIENLLAIHEPKAIAGGDVPMMGFETLTLCPIDRRLIAPEMLDKAERDWLNAYHKEVYEQLSPYLGNQDKDWLLRATQTI